MNNSEFWPFQVAILEQFLYTNTATVYWGSLYKLF